MDFGNRQQISRAIYRLISTLARKSKRNRRSSERRRGRTRFSREKSSSRFRCWAPRDLFRGVETEKKMTAVSVNGTRVGQIL